MASNKCMVVNAVFIVAFAVVKASQCSSGGEGPVGNKPNNVVSMLQTKLQRSALKDEGAAPSASKDEGAAPALGMRVTGELMSDTAEKAGLAADEALLKHVIEQWSVEPAQSVDRSPSSFRQRHQCQEESLLATTFQSLDANTGGSLNFSDIPSLLKQNVGVVKFSIRTVGVGDIKIGFDPNNQGPRNDKQIGIRGRLVFAQLRALLDEVDLPDMDLMVSTLDGSPQDQDHVGIMRTEGCAGKDLLMIPRSLLRLQPSKAQHPVCLEHFPQAVFRGGNNARPLQSNMRYFAANLSKSRPDLLDAGFTDAGHGWTRADVLQRFMKNHLTYKEQQCYSAALVIDGYSVPDRLPQQLLTGLPTVFMHGVHDDQLKNDCTLDEFWYNELTPDVDFIAADSSNLESVLENLHKDPERGTRIGESGKKYVQNHLTLNRLKCYLHQLLSEYGRRYVMK